MAELVYPLSAFEILETVLAQGLQYGFRRQPVPAQVVGNLGHQRLAAVAYGKKACHAVKRRAEIVAVARFRYAGMKRHPDLHARLLRPGLGREGALRSQRCGKRLRSGCESSTEGIARRLEDEAAMGFDTLANQGVVTSERRPHSLGLLLPHPGAAFDVGEQKR